MLVHKNLFDAQKKVIFMLRQCVRKEFCSLLPLGRCCSFPLGSGGWCFDRFYFSCVEAKREFSPSQPVPPRLRRMLDENGRWTIQKPMNRRRIEDATKIRLKLQSRASGDTHTCLFSFLIFPNLIFFSSRLLRKVVKKDVDG